MKSRKIINPWVIKGFVILLLIIDGSSGYSQCISNPTFANPCNDPNSLTTSSNCEPPDPPTGPFNSFTQTCIPNWKRTHGSPTYGSGGISLRGHDLHGTRSSEGIAGGFNFQPNTAYCLRVEYTMSNLGSITTYHPRFIIAAANLSSGDFPTNPSCPQALPSISYYEIATVQTLGTNTFTLSGFDVGNSTYNYIWIFTMVDDVQDSSNAVWLTLESVNVCLETCNSTKVYDVGIAPSGVSDYGTILAGSTAGGGSGSVVTNAASQQTTFRAGNHIKLSPDFKASASGTGFFRAKIEVCDTAHSCSHGGDSETKLQKDIDSYSAIPAINIKAYPSPAKQELIIELPEVLKESDKRIIDIFNTQGILVRRQQSVSSLNKISIQNLSPGIYYVRVVDEKGKATTIRFIKQ